MLFTIIFVVSFTVVKLHANENSATIRTKIATSWSRAWHNLVTDTKK